MEKQLARRRAELTEIEGAILAVTSATAVVPKPRKPNPIFRPSDIPRLTLTALREVKGPVQGRDLVSFLLAVKGAHDASQATRNVVTGRLRVYLWRAGRNGLIHVVGEGEWSAARVNLKLMCDHGFSGILAISSLRIA